MQAPPQVSGAYDASPGRWFFATARRSAMGLASNRRWRWLAGVAPARNNNCSRIVSNGTNKAYPITGSNRTQTIVVEGGNDRTSGGAGDDSVYGQACNNNLSDTRGPNTDAVDRDGLEYP